MRLDQGGQLTNEPDGFYNHFVRLSDHDQWKADFYAVADLSRPIRFALDADGYASVLAPTAKGYVVEPGQVGALWLTTSPRAWPLTSRPVRSLLGG